MTDPTLTDPRAELRAALAAARRRAGQEQPADSPLLPPSGRDRFEVLSSSLGYDSFFRVEDWQVRHRLHQGGWGAPAARATWVSGDAVVMLPWDVARDRVLVIDQFRLGPAVRGDRQCWLTETIAGRIDAGETPEQTARREAVEEAGLALGPLIAGPHHYPSPGTVAEYIYLFLAPCDLPDGMAGIGGEDAEGEDIRSHLIDRAEVTQMARDGMVRNGPLLTLLFWLAADLPGLRARARAVQAQP